MYDDKKYKKDLNQIRTGLRQAFIRSRYRAEFLKTKRIEIPQYKKDGSLAKRPKVVYKCECCHTEYPVDNINVDHISKVGSFTSFEDIESFFFAIFCPWSNLQILCKP